MKIRNLVLGLVILLSAFSSRATDMATTQEEALSRALAVMLAKPDQAKEYATAIIQSPEGFMFAPIVCGDGDSFSLKVALHKSQRIVALLHTHPGTGGANHYFSPQDVAMAQQLSVPSFIYIVETEQAKEFVPGQDRLSSSLNGRLTTNHIALGRGVKIE